jgi:hypothetical protein
MQQQVTLRSNINDIWRIQSQIVQELRNLSRAHKLPIITATQNAKISENMNVSLDNSQIGDSYKKVRYAD